MWELDHKAGHQRIDSFELWCCIRLLRVPWTARRSNQSILKEISSEYSLEVLILKYWYWTWSCSTLATWCKQLTHWKRPWCWGRLKAKGEEGNRGWDGWMPSPTQWTWIWVNSGSWWWTGSLVCCSPCGHKESDMKCDWTELNWTELNWMKQKIDGFFFSNSLAFSMIQQMLVVSQKSEIKLIQQFHF